MERSRLGYEVSVIWWRARSVEKIILREWEARVWESSSAQTLKLNSFGRVTQSQDLTSSGNEETWSGRQQIGAVMVEKRWYNKQPQSQGWGCLGKREEQWSKGGIEDSRKILPFSTFFGVKLWYFPSTIGKSLREAVTSGRSQPFLRARREL